LPIRGGHDVGWVRDLTVGKLMARDVRTVPAGMKLAELRRQFPLGGMRHIFVVDDQGRYDGVVQTTQMHLPDFDAQENWLVAQNFAFAEKLFLTQGQSVQSALDIFTESENETLAVVSDAESRKIVGYLTEGYAARRYRQELERVRNEELGQSKLFSSV
jgi:CIC family chloride channel protein